MQLLWAPSDLNRRQRQRIEDCSLLKLSDRLQCHNGNLNKQQSRKNYIDKDCEICYQIKKPFIELSYR